MLAPLVVLAVAVAFAGLALLAPTSAADLLAKEGPVEHASHLVLLLAVLAWTALAVRRRRPARLLAALAAAFLALVLAEELDWGAVYGWGGISQAVAGVFGHRNMHNAARGASYLLFAAPLAAFFAWPAHALAATPGERHAFLLLAALFLACNLTPW